MTSDNPLEIDVRLVRQWLDSGEPFLLLDVREPAEHAAAHIAQAVLIPMGQLHERVAELAPHRDGRIVVHCHHGGRSLRVTHWLRAQGFVRVHNMQGGIDAWSLEIDANVPRY